MPGSVGAFTSKSWKFEVNALDSFIRQMFLEGSVGAGQ